MQDFETLGAFYLGRPYDLSTRTATPAPLMYDSRDLLTHAVCIGMTGQNIICIGCFPNVYSIRSIRSTIGKATSRLWSNVFSIPFTCV